MRPLRSSNLSENTALPHANRQMDWRERVVEMKVKSRTRTSKKVRPKQGKHTIKEPRFLSLDTNSALLACGSRRFRGRRCPRANMRVHSTVVAHQVVKPALLISVPSQDVQRIPWDHSHNWDLGASWNGRAIQTTFGSVSLRITVSRLCNLRVGLVAVLHSPLRGRR
jgi:hypothetical protein